MCVLVIKFDKDGNPHRAKSRIVVLGHFEDRYYTKSQRYAPVLKYSSLRLLYSKAVEKKRILQQDDCKNAFVTPSYQKMNLPSLARQLVTPTMPKMSIGSSTKPCMGYAVTPITGLTHSPRPSAIWASRPQSMTPASFQV
jgi:hypothetical protein